jgi:uncharacterized protein (TIGR01777 family)
VQWSAKAGVEDKSRLAGFDAFVHLAGAPIAGGLWTARRKREIEESRVCGTKNLVEAFRGCGEAPDVVVSASAVGFYGSRGDEELDEDSLPGLGFLAEVCSKWEAEASRISELGSRVVILRTGIALSPSGGVLSKMLLPFKLGLGGRLGNGRQFLSWIHLDDEIKLIKFALVCEELAGPVNATAPVPVTNLEFTQTLAKRLRRPALLPVPSWVLRTVFGEMAEALVLEGQRVLPRKADAAGFRFDHPKLAGALSDLLR